MPVAESGRSASAASPGRRVGLLCARLQLPDATGYDVLHQARVLQNSGYEVQIFAESYSAAAAAESSVPVSDLRELSSAGASGHLLSSPQAIAIYHYAVYSSALLGVLRRLGCRKVLCYHNVTPPEFFEPYDRGISALLRAGRELLPAHLAAGVDLVLGDSGENLRDLEQANAQQARDQQNAVPGRVVAPFHRVPELLDTEGEVDLAWLRQLNDGAANLLSVGRLAPNKGYAALLQAFALLVDRMAGTRACRLILAGGPDPRLHRYYAELRSVIAAAGLESRVWVVGSVSLAELRALYQSADLLLAPSEHEGFCLPLVEAMAHGLPIVAHAAAAIPETLGDAGLLVESRASQRPGDSGETSQAAVDPVAFALSCEKLLSDSQLYQKLAAKGRARYRARFTNEAIAAEFKDAIAGLA